MEARQLQVPGFKASPSWLYDFKIKHSLVSRKILRVISPRMIVEERDIEQSGEDFVMKVKTWMAAHPNWPVFNADQSGFEKELHSGRTLETRGAKQVEAVVQSIAATTHSYTILPTISADGRLMSPLFIVLQEKNGRFPETVPIFQAPNIYPVAHTSHIMTKELMKEWLRGVYFRHAPASSGLLLDSWICWMDSDAIKVWLMAEITPSLHKRISIIGVHSVEQGGHSAQHPEEDHRQDPAARCLLLPNMEELREGLLGSSADRQLAHPALSAGQHSEAPIAGPQPVLGGALRGLHQALVAHVWLCGGER
jgi:hypothetical protein